MKTKTKDYLDQNFFLDAEGNNLFSIESAEPMQHFCQTDHSESLLVVGHSSNSTQKNELTELVVGLQSNIPLWQQNVTLKWRFNPMFNNYNNSEDVKDYIRNIFGQAVNKWGDASPIAFMESTDEWDFEIIMHPNDCNPIGGCTLAKAFFPGRNQNTLTLYPKLFNQSSTEQIETIIHEMGHIFGLRHYFAQERESSWRSEVFGTHVPLTIMNYGPNSVLTDQDKLDLHRLYDAVWTGTLQNINGLPIQLQNCYTQIN
ncbi:matrixin family metalloprotease [Fluviicola sp.]|uniref:matrixin family metalloprotease n=1 Tax=Fluviicola sp. TaxID=1917219 RepID=UPI0031DAB50B